MARNFPNFLDAYMKWAKDNFVPEQFNTWSGLSIISGALERKVWLPWTDVFSYYPNIFVLMVSLPGVGKSTALNKALGLLMDMNARENKLNVIPSQVTEAKFIEIMGNASAFQVGSKLIYQSAGYYWASEASNSLKNVYGDFIACLTDFYDCPTYWEKATKKDDKITLRNISLNLLAGSTFDYLSKLVTDENIMGGFASRLIYVVHREKLVRTQKFQLGGAATDASRARDDYRRALIEDLGQIHKMVGPFTASPEFGRAWEEWYPKFERERQDNPSEKMQSLLVRTNTNVLKLSMLFSAARSDERILTIDDWDAALTCIEPIQKEIPAIFRESKALDTKSQGGLNAAILRAFIMKGEVTIADLQMALVMAGQSSQHLERTLNVMRTAGRVVASGMSNGAVKFKFIGNPDEYI